MKKGTLTLTRPPGTTQDVAVISGLYFDDDGNTVAYMEPRIVHLDRSYELRIEGNKMVLVP